MSEIEQLLPHREPFLFVDEIVSTDKDTIIAKHVITEKEFFLAGHFTEYPVEPGFILIETI
jgi:3-hydroxyacyl-[acyl-carrier-protein] dehydratase